MFVERAAEFGLVFQHHSAAVVSTTCRRVWGQDAAFLMPMVMAISTRCLSEVTILRIGGRRSRNTFFKTRARDDLLTTPSTQGSPILIFYGVTCGDVDADGDIDLYITNFGKDCLYYNDGTGQSPKRQRLLARPLPILLCRPALWTTTEMAIWISSSPDTWTGRSILSLAASTLRVDAIIATLSDTGGRSPIGCCRTTDVGSSPM